MYRGTTPTIIINVKGEAFEDSTIYVTIEQSPLQITKTGDDVIVEPTSEGCRLLISLTQEETLKFVKGYAKLQIRWINTSGIAQASPIKTINVDPILLKGVITYGS